MPITTSSTRKSRKTRRSKRASRPKKLSASKLKLERKSCWELWSDAQTEKAFAFAEGYKEFLSVNKTERLSVKAIQSMAEEQGYISIDAAVEHTATGTATDRPLRVYAINRNKSIIMARLGKKPLRTGTRMILSHIDCPRLDLKVRPLYEDSGIAFLKTHYYGGIKKYQWPTIPLALYGTVVLKNGKTINLAIGDAEEDPVFTISDLLPHLGKKQLEKVLGEAIQGEELNLLVGSIPDKREKNEKNKIKLKILKLLYERYGIVEADFITADIEIVPAGKARDLGFDRSMIIGYGHDDRVCAYSSLKSLLDSKTTQHANVLLFTDKEEIGSTSNTGVTSSFFYDTIGRLVALEEELPERTELDTQIREILISSQAISADVTAAYDPDYKEVFDQLNSAQLGCGVALEKYTGSRGKSFTSEANAEFMARVREVFDGAGVPWQTGGLGKVDAGGGATVAMFLAEYNMDIVDCGLPVLSMHAPYEVVSKADLYSAYLAYGAFLNS